MDRVGFSEVLEAPTRCFDDFVDRVMKMHKALHPYHNGRVSVPEYVREFGPEVDEVLDKPRCPVCKGRMNIVASSTAGSVGHFAHQRNSGHCPTKSRAANPYRNLPPRNPDPASAARIKVEFFENWQCHYSKLNYLVKGLAIEEFIDIVRTADRERIWEYANLEAYQLPYIFATLVEFPPGRSFKGKDGNPVRKLWFRCWFDASVQRYDDLWIHRETPLLFWRAWYKPPQGRGRPSSEHLIDSYDEPLSAEFLNQEVTLHPYVENRVSQWLTQNLNF